jgi:hypothetical protein
MSHWDHIWNSAYDWTNANVPRCTPEWDEVCWLMMAFGRCLLAVATDFEEERDATRD